MTIEKVLVVDDEPLVRKFVEETLKRKGIDVKTASCGKEAIHLLKEQAFDLVLTDMKMPDITGLEVLKKVKEISPSTLVAIITAYGSIENAVEAMRLGAFTYLVKPFTADCVEMLLSKGQEQISLVQENRYLKEQAQKGERGESKKTIAESPAMKKLLEEAKRVATSSASVMITGESGTGKEVLAHEIHYNSPRKNRPFIKVNCAAIPATLVESEFFGHEKGAFTGADSKRVGRFELASGGTLLLDEITEVPLEIQSKLLRAIQEQEFERVGGTKSIKVDVRIIAASNRDVKEALQKKALREDLFYRLNVIPMYIPPLRERREDILPLCEALLKEFCKVNHKGEKTLTQEAKKKLESYPWPGNVREVCNVIERAVVLDAANQIEPEHLFLEMAQQVKMPGSLPTGITLEELEKRFIIETLQLNKMQKKRTADQLGISARTLRNKLQEYNLCHLDTDEM